VFCGVEAIFDEGLMIIYDSYVAICGYSWLVIWRYMAKNTRYTSHSYLNSSLSILSSLNEVIPFFPGFL
jgi:hypothetical protein